MLNNAHQQEKLSKGKKVHIPAWREHGRPDASPSAMRVGLVLLEEEPRCIEVAG